MKGREHPVSEKEEEHAHLGFKKGASTQSHLAVQLKGRDQGSNNEAMTESWFWPLFSLQLSASGDHTPVLSVQLQFAAEEGLNQTHLGILQG